MPPPRASVRKQAGDDGEPALMPLYDCDGQLFGVAEAGDIVPALDPDVVMKAEVSGMIANHDPVTGKATGFVDPDAVTPVTTDMTGLGKPGKPVPPSGAKAARQVSRPGWAAIGAHEDVAWEKRQAGRDRSGAGDGGCPADQPGDPSRRRSAGRLCWTAVILRLWRRSWR